MKAPQPLNLCRQFKIATVSFRATAQQARLDDPIYERAHKAVARAEKLASLLDGAVKFQLPENGRLLDDPHYKALDEGVRLRLPYPCVVLEYLSSLDTLPPLGSLYLAAKVIVLARETEDGIVIQPAHFLRDVVSREAVGWATMPEVLVQTDDYIRRDASREGRPLLGFEILDGGSKEYPPHEYVAGVGVVFAFLNALSCSNVQQETAPVRVKVPRHCKDALPFDEYKFLTIATSAGRSESMECGGTHRSPREHLRRGHIVRHPSGRPFWRNATIVNPGVGGRIEKQYLLKAAA